MKLTQTQYSELTECLMKHGRRTEEFAFIKRKGRITITENRSGKLFSYFKKKSAEINPATQRLEAFHIYSVKTADEKEKEMKSWEEVLGALCQWLSDINRSR